MAEKKYRLVGGYWTDNSMSFYIRFGAGSWVEVPLASAGAGQFSYVSGNADSDDILQMFWDDLAAAITAYPGQVISFVEQPQLDMATGIVSMTYDDGDGLGDLQIKWEHPTTPLTNPTSYFLHNALRLTATQSSTITIAGGGAGSVTADRCHGYGMYPLRYMMTDLSEWEARVSQAVPDQGTVQTLRSAMLEKYRLGIRTDRSYPRAAIFNEHHALIDFMDNASSGRPFRVYPDKTILTAYADVTNPFGYREWVMDKDSASWRPTPVTAQWYKAFDVELMAWAYIT